MAFPQSSRATANFDIGTDGWFFCDRCGFRYNRESAIFQFDWRGASLANIRLLVCTETCNDVPFELNRPIIIGPDPYPVKDPRPGWQQTQQGYTPAVDILELLDGDLIPGGGGGGSGGGLGNDGGVLFLLTPPSGWPSSDLLVPAGGFYSNGGECTIAPGVFTPVSGMPQTINSISAAQLLALGAYSLPLTSPPMGSGILWNPWGFLGGPVYIA